MTNLVSQPKPRWQPLQQTTFVDIACPVCESRDAEYRFGKQIVGIEMKYWVCRQCRALYANPRATEECLRSVYGSKEFFAGGTPGEDNIDYYDFIGGEKYLRLTARDRISRIQKHCPRGKLLEVASAAGFFLIEARNAGFDVSGVEFSEPMAKYASERWQIPVVPQSIETHDLPQEAYDVIASWGVMTIIQDPIALFKKFHEALKPGGIWAFNTYYHDGWWVKLFGGRWSHLGVQVSQVYARQQLLGLLKEHGFKLLSRRRDMPYTDVLKVTDQLGPMLGMRWLPRLVQKLHLHNALIKVPLPDVLEYVCQKI